MNTKHDMRIFALFSRFQQYKFTFQPWTADKTPCTGRISPHVLRQIHERDVTTAFGTDIVRGADDDKSPSIRPAYSNHRQAAHALHDVAKPPLSLLLTPAMCCASSCHSSRGDGYVSLLCWCCQGAATSCPTWPAGPQAGGENFSNAVLPLSQSRTRPLTSNRACPPLHHEAPFGALLAPQIPLPSPAD